MHGALGRSGRLRQMSASGRNLSLKVLVLSRARRSARTRGRVAIGRRGEASLIEE